MSSPRVSLNNQNSERKPLVAPFKVTDHQIFQEQLVKILGPILEYNRKLDDSSPCKHSEEESIAKKSTALHITESKPF